MAHSRSTFRKQVLIVETDLPFRAQLEETAGALAEVTAVADIESALAHVAATPFDLVVTNLWLGFECGLDLALLAPSGAPTLRLVVYGEPLDSAMAQEVQRVGAFFESYRRIRYALPAYIDASLPVLDRRNPTSPDRRTAAYRGGRRASDVPLIIRKR
jgi:ActR/RegA family two-component response regulator